MHQGRQLPNNIGLIDRTPTLHDLLNGVVKAHLRYCYLNLSDGITIDATSGHSGWDVGSSNPVSSVVVGIGEVEKPALLGYVADNGRNSLQTTCRHHEVHS